MRKRMRFGAAVLLALTLCVAFGVLLFAYMRPMEDRVYDFSLSWAGEAMPEGWVYDQKGWTVFTQEGDERTELVPDGFGAFNGLGEPGQTFYFSRVLSEEVDSPTLRLQSGACALAVFLDGVPLYTDCPEQDNRIGYLRLSVLEWYREEPVVVTLPRSYAGKTLTVAQAADPSGGETQEPATTVWPCAVTLYCGYAYESALVAGSFQTAVPAALAFAAGTLLLALFLYQVFQGRPALDALLGAVLAFFALAGRLEQSALPSVIPLAIDAGMLASYLSITLLLVFLASRLTRWRRWAVGLFALAEAARREIVRRTEERLLVKRGELAQSGYEALRRQHEQVMMLRHDMVKHFQVLRQTVTDEKSAAYLDELIGENEKIRPVVQSGNEMLDVILNGKLSAAADAGITVEIARMKAPDKLPLTDAELCSLVMNLLDNAVESAFSRRAAASSIPSMLAIITSSRRMWNCAPPRMAASRAVALS